MACLARSSLVGRARCLAPVCGRQAGRLHGGGGSGRCAAASVAQQAAPSAAAMRLQRGPPARGCFSSVGGSPQATLIQKSWCGGLWGLLRIPLALGCSRRVAPPAAWCNQARVRRICQLMALPSAQGLWHVGLLARDTPAPLAEPAAQEPQLREHVPQS
jgi:hypothetical protein